MDMMARRRLLLSQARLVTASSGNTADSDVIAKFETSMAADMAACVVNLSYDANGINSVTLYTAGKNLWPSGWELGGISSSNGANTATSDRLRTIGYVPTIPNQVYAISRNLKAGYDQIRTYGFNKNFIGGSSTVTFLSQEVQSSNPMYTNATWVVIKNLSNYFWRFADRASKTPSALQYMMVAGNTVETEYIEPNVSEYQILFGRTIYGGTLDVISGTLVSMYAVDGTPLPTPEVYEVTPQTISTLAGVNNVWSKQGTVTVKYWTR